MTPLVRAAARRVATTPRRPRAARPRRAGSRRDRRRGGAALGGRRRRGERRARRRRASRSAVRRLAPARARPVRRPRRRAPRVRPRPAGAPAAAAAARPRRRSGADRGDPPPGAAARRGPRCSASRLRDRRGRRARARAERRRRRAGRESAGARRVDARALGVVAHRHDRRAAPHRLRHPRRRPQSGAREPVRAQRPRLRAAPAGPLRRGDRAAASRGRRATRPPARRGLPYAFALFNLAVALNRSGNPAEAVPLLRERLKFDNQRDTVQAELDDALRQARPGAAGRGQGHGKGNGKGRRASATTAEPRALDSLVRWRSGDRFVGSGCWSCSRRWRAPPLARAQAPPLRSVPVGSAVRLDTLQSDARYRDTFLREFDSLTPENELKMAALQPRRGRYDFEAADELVRFALRNGKAVRGHTLIWGQSLPLWLVDHGVTDKLGLRLPPIALPPLPDPLGPLGKLLGDTTTALTGWRRDELMAVMKDHIRRVMRHFAGDVARVGRRQRADRGGRHARADRLAAVHRPGLHRPGAARRAHRRPAREALHQRLRRRVAGAEARRPARARPRPQGAPGPARRHRPAGALPHRADPRRGDARRDDARASSGWGSRCRSPRWTWARRCSASRAPTGCCARRAAYGAAARACNAVAACTRFTTWGFTDAVSWLASAESGLLFDRSYRPKPAYAAVRSAFAPR